MACAVQAAAGASGALPRPKGPTHAKGVVTFNGTGFSVMNVQLVLGSRLSFSNPGDGALDVRILTWLGKPVANLPMRAHAHAAWTPARYGVYVYLNARTTDFGSVSIRGSHGEKVYQAVARKSSLTFPTPAYGVVVVTNAAGGGIPLSSSYGPAEVPAPGDLSVKHHRRFMNHPPWIEVARGTMTYKPWVLVVRAGQPIHVYNSDSMKHSFFPGVYRVMDLNHGHVSWYHGFRGFHLTMNEGHHTIVLHRPGVHHIFCKLHSYPWKHTYKPYTLYGGFPYIMDAVVVVEPRRKS